ncbi:MAG: Asp-tRNA(Asn)/Glu-tRNA(Gln) amidotransferase subunit GatC [Candidatus Babeliaceae bacterium]|jgi:aspartyl/glutamyl-tRNA(Asn/Gln) amidotransferase C subunit
MSKITREEILKLAQTSQINLSDAEVGQLIHDLDSVLTYASGLQAIAHSYGECALDNKTKNVTRPDSVVAYESHVLIEQAPLSEENFFVVPKIIK